MAVEVGDCATVLEQFVHDAANLPAEINYMMEEVQAIDKEMQRYLSAINSRENTLQKQVKAHGSLVAHPKEQEFAAFTKKHYDLCIDLQQKKINHSDKACVMLDRQLKRLDERIQQLTKYGHLDEDVTLPSIFNRRPDQKLPFDLPIGNVPLQPANISALNANAHRLNSHATPTIRQPQSRQVAQVATITAPTQRSATPTTPVVPAVGQKSSQEREQSQGADSKRRKLNMSTTGINLPNNPSGLRQSSIGPGTPKASTPTGSRAGSLPRTTGPAVKKATATGVAAVLKKGTATHQQVNKLKSKYNKHARLSQSGGRKKAGSPAVRGVRGGTEASEDSVLSSAEASDTDTSQAKRRRKKQVHEPEPPSASEEEGDDETDDKLYCYCNQRSFGEMVGCENPNCKREWFHIGCLNLKTVPQEEHWYCPECRADEGVGGNKKRK